MSTPIHERIERIRAGDDPQCLGRMRSGYAILGKHQPGAIPGCCMLLPDLPAELLDGSGCPSTPAHLNDLPAAARSAFLTDLALLGDAVQRATSCERLNYLILCNQVPALHGHVIPRFASEAPGKRRLGPFEAYDFAGARIADATGADADLFARLRAALESVGGLIGS
jgi:diadenosine tetraphosphate (Ap4A) HIT family hydrolase